MSDAEKARRLVRDVILAQTNVFIKELLFEKGIQGGVTKDDFQQKLEDGISAGTITYVDLQAWVDDVEGWGDEHVYIYRMLDPIGDLLDDEKRVAARVDKAGLGAFWKRDASLAFPNTLRLTRIDLTGNELTCTWHRRTDWEKRDGTRDFDHWEGDEHYFYKAYREVARRDVFRVVLKPSVMAVFIPGGQEPKTHGDLREALANDVVKLMRFSNCEPYSMSEAIKILDSAATKAKVKRTLRARITRFNSPSGGSVQFASATDESYADVEALREVRGAVQLRKFRGGAGEVDFYPPVKPGSGAKQSAAAERRVRVHLYDAYDRIRIYTRLTRDDVWWILRKIPKRVK